MAEISKNNNQNSSMNKSIGQDDAQRASGLEAQEAASYIASIGANLQKVADSASMPFLSYLLSLVVEEARQSEQEKDKTAHGADATRR